LGVHGSSPKGFLHAVSAVNNFPNAPFSSAFPPHLVYFFPVITLICQSMALG